MHAPMIRIEPAPLARPTTRRDRTRPPGTERSLERALRVWEDDGGAVHRPRRDARGTR